jgi:hypothetical protein
VAAGISGDVSSQSSNQMAKPTAEHAAGGPGEENSRSPRPPCEMRFMAVTTWKEARVSDQELLERVLAILGGVDQKLKIAKSRVADEHLNSAYTDIAGLIIMIRDHGRRPEPPTTE